MKSKPFLQPVRTVITIATCVAIFAIAASAGTSQKQEIQNIVLVRGARVDGSGWKAVTDLLTHHGYQVSIVQIPETSFEDDVAAVKRAITQQPGPCILVADSYGGSVISEVGVDPKVAGLFYVATHATEHDTYEARPEVVTSAIEQAAQNALSKN